MIRIKRPDRRFKQLGPVQQAVSPPGVAEQFAEGEAAKAESEERKRAAMGVALPFLPDAPKAAPGMALPLNEEKPPLASDGEVSLVKGSTEPTDNEKWLAGLAAAQQVGAQLDQAMNVLNAQINAAEEKLAALKLGVRGQAYVEHSTHGQHYRKLLFTKEQGRWRLMIETGRIIGIGKYEEDDCILLSQASRTVRLNAVKVLPLLVQSMIFNVGQELETVKATTQEIDRFSTSLARFTVEKK